MWGTQGEGELTVCEGLDEEGKSGRVRLDGEGVHQLLEHCGEQLRCHLVHRLGRRHQDRDQAEGRSPRTTQCQR